MTEQSSRDLYARIAEVPDEDVRRIAAVLEIRGRHPQQIRIRDAYLEQAAPWVGRRVLDAGCGTGVVTRDLARRVGPTGSVVGVDPSPVFLEEARRLAAAEQVANLEFAVGDARSLDFGDGSFDAVVAHTVFSHVPDLAGLLHELARVLRPGGLLLACDGDYASNLLVHPDGPLTRRIVDTWLETVVHDPRVMRRAPVLVREAGLELVRFDGHVHVECGPVAESDSFLWNWAGFALSQSLAAGAVDAAAGERWLAELRAVNESGGMLGSVTYYSVVARKP